MRPSWWESSKPNHKSCSQEFNVSPDGSNNKACLLFFFLQISAVRAVVPNKSNNEIVLVLQHFENCVDKAVQAFLEGMTSTDGPPLKVNSNCWKAAWPRAQKLTHILQQRLRVPPGCGVICVFAPALVRACEPSLKHMTFGNSFGFFFFFFFLVPSHFIPGVLGSQTPERHLHAFTLTEVIIDQGARSLASRRIVPNFSTALEQSSGTLVRGDVNDPVQDAARLAAYDCHRCAPLTFR